LALAKSGRRISKSEEIRMSLVSEYFGDNNGKASRVINTGNGYMIELLVEW
jgi:hypothetical protein